MINKRGDIPFFRNSGRSSGLRPDEQDVSSLSEDQTRLFPSDEPEMVSPSESPEDPVILSEREDSSHPEHEGDDEPFSEPPILSGEPEPIKTYPLKPAISWEGVVSFLVIIAFFGVLACIMGGSRLVDSIFAVSYRLLMDVCFYIMSMAVITGGLAAFLSEFGVISLIDRPVAFLMRPVYGLPGSASIGVISTFLSDNPAILSLCRDRNFASSFKRYQMPALTNLGTSFGMGFMVIMYIVRMKPWPGDPVGLAAVVGLLGAVIGSIISTRLMLLHTSALYGKEAMWVKNDASAAGLDHRKFRIVRPGSLMNRFLDSLLEGGKSGVEIGLQIIPGVLIICTLVTILTNKPSDTIAGVGFFPWVGEKLQFIVRPLFGFESPEAIAVPVTALGSAGASLGLISRLYSDRLICARDLAVMVSMCMCWSGYLSTHVAMMDSLGCRNLAGRAILCHTIGGLAAGISANYLFRLFTL